MSDAQDGDVLAGFRERRAAHDHQHARLDCLDGPLHTDEWNAAEAWVVRMLSLTKPGGVVSVILPDQKVFTVKKPQA